MPQAVQKLSFTLTDADYQSLANAKAGRLEPGDIEERRFDRKESSDMVINTAPWRSVIGP